MKNTMNLNVEEIRVNCAYAVFGKYMSTASRCGYGPLHYVDNYNMNIPFSLYEDPNSWDPRDIAKLVRDDRANYHGALERPEETIKIKQFKGKRVIAIYSEGTAFFIYLDEVVEEEESEEGDE